MGNVVDFSKARNKKELQRKEDLVSSVKGAFKSSRESSQPTPSSVQKLKGLFRKPPTTRSPNKKK